MLYINMQSSIKKTLFYSRQEVVFRFLKLIFYIIFTATIHL